MPKLPSWSGFENVFRKTTHQPRQASIYRWLTWGMAFVVIATLIIGGVPAAGIMWWQLEHHIRPSVLGYLAVFLGTGILAGLAGTGLAILLARRTTQPLRILSQAAERMGAGDLQTPIPLTSGWISIDRLASQLDLLRRNVLQTQQITRGELRRVTHLLGAIREGVITLNMDGVVTWINSDACQMLGCDAGTILRKHYSQIFRPAPGEVVTLGDVLQPHLGQQLPDRVTILDVHDHPITLTVSSSLLGNADRDAASHPSPEVVLVVRDVSDEFAVNRLRSEFMANMAHEFRTPLSAISAATELLVDEGPDMTSDELSDLGHTIRLSTVHLQSLVNNLLESAVIEAGVFCLRYRSVEVHDILSDVAEMMAPLLHRRKQDLKLNVARDLPELWADADRLKQALVNLVGNASKFSPTAAVIDLLVEKEVDTLTFIVSDSGPGLPAERFRDLFNRFVTSTRPYGAQYGIGLGLPIVKAIAEAHGGRVGAKNRPEGGASVWFTIPIKQQSREGDGA